MNLKRFWPPEAHHRVMVLLSTAAVVIVVAHIFLPKALLDKAEIDIPLVTLVLLALYVLAYVGNEAEESGLRHAAELGLKEVFSSRLEAGQSDEYSDLLENAKSELFVVGVTLKDLTSDVGGVLRERVRKGCRVELLILSPEFRDNNPPPVDPIAFANSDSTLKNNFSIAIANIRRLAKDIRNFNREQEASKSHRSRAHTLGGLSVRFYTSIPTVSLIARDGDDSNGRMHVEVIPHQTSTSQFRPILNIEKRGMENGLFSKFYKQYRILWTEESISYLDVRSTRIDIDRELDRKVSEWLGLSSTWLDGAQDRAASGKIESQI